MFFDTYAKIEDIWVTPALLEGYQVIAVYEGRGSSRPAYFTWLEWAEERIVLIRDYRYVRYILESAELDLLPESAEQLLEPSNEMKSAVGNIPDFSLGTGSALEQ